MLFVDDADLMTNGEQDITKMQKILTLYDKLFRATNGLIEIEKSMFFAWKWQWKQGQKAIKHREVEMKIRN